MRSCVRVSPVPRRLARANVSRRTSRSRSMRRFTAGCSRAALRRRQVERPSSNPETRLTLEGTPGLILLDWIAGSLANGHIHRSLVMSDLRVILRNLLRQPTLNALAVLALGLGIGLAAMMFSIVYGVVLRGSPFERSEQLVHVARTQLAAGIPRMQATIHDFADWRARQRTFEDVAAYKNRTVALATSAGPPVRLQGADITPEAFRLLRVHPLIGRTFAEGERGASAPDVVLLSYYVWRDHFGRDPQIVGRAIRVDARPTVVIGVMPDGFTFPFRHDVWMPLHLDPMRVARGQGDTFEVFGRLRDGL